MIQQMTLDNRKIFPDIFRPVSLPTGGPLWVLFDWSAISLDIQLRSVPYFTTNTPPDVEMPYETARDRVHSMNVKDVKSKGEMH